MINRVKSILMGVLLIPVNIFWFFLYMVDFLIGNNFKDFDD